MTAIAIEVAILLLLALILTAIYTYTITYIIHITPMHNINWLMISFIKIMTKMYLILMLGITIYIILITLFFMRCKDGFKE